MQVFETNGTYITTYGSGKGSGPSNVYYPRGLTVVGSIVYVADSNNYRIQFAPDATGFLVAIYRKLLCSVVPQINWGSYKAFPT